MALAPPDLRPRRGRGERAARRRGAGGLHGRRRTLSPPRMSSRSTAMAARRRCTPWSSWRCATARGAAGRGEFTLRAFLNGRLDLSQAEAVLDVVRARTPTALHVAVEHLAGGLSRRLRPVVDDLMSVLAFLEASIDFVEEGIPPAATATPAGAAGPRRGGAARAPGHGAGRHHPARGAARGPGRRAQRRQVEPAEPPAARRARHRHAGRRDDARHGRGAGQYPRSAGLPGRYGRPDRDATTRSSD